MPFRTSRLTRRWPWLLLCVLGPSIGSCTSPSYKVIEDAHPSYDTTLLKTFGFDDALLAKSPALTSLINGEHVYEGDAKRSWIATPFAMSSILEESERGSHSLIRYLARLYLASRDGGAAEHAFERDISEYIGGLKLLRRYMGCPEGADIVKYLRANKLTLRSTELKRGSER